YRLTGDAAYLNVSPRGRAELDRGGLKNQSGAILVDPGATLSSVGSIDLDASTDARIDGSLDMNGGALALGARRISLGEGGGSAGGLVLTPTLLQNLKVDELVLSSATDIGLFGPVNLSAKQLSFRSGAILGFANAGGVTQLTADSITLENPQGSNPGRVADGSGRIEFTAKELELGQGNYRLDGFSVANFNLSGNMTGTGAGHLTSGADLNIKAAELTGGRGADTVIDASGHAVTLGSSASSGVAGTERLGARLSIVADSIAQAGRIVMPSGVVKLEALKGKLAVDSAALIDVSGRQVHFGDTTIATDGGQILLDAHQGDVNLQAGARLDLHGEKGGTLVVTVPNGGFQFSGQVDAQGTVSAGNFRLDARALDSDLGILGAQLSASGFDGSVQVRSRTGDMSLAAGQKLAAHSVSLTTDSGSLAITGDLTASGAGAELNLSAGQTLRLADSAILAAHGSAERGGKVSLQADNPGAGIEIRPGAKIDLASADGKSNGSLAMRVARAGNDVAISGSLQGVLSGAARSTVEAVKTYVSSGVIGSADIATYKADTDAFMTGAQAIENRLGLPGGLRPGVEIVSNGNLSLGGGWDLLAWRYGGRPGVLSLRAGNDLNINQNLSDGFKAYDKEGIDLSGLLGAGQTMPVADMLQPGLSWSYRLSAGRDVNVGADVLVRTGTGDIDIASGRDFVLSNAGSVVYTAGRPTDMDRYGSFKNAFVAFQFYGEYPVEGGRLAIDAGRDVRGAPSGQFFDGWLTRTGEWSRNTDHSGETPTSWAVSLGTPDRNFIGQAASGSVFRQNLGSFGGGDVSVRAGGDVTNLSVMMPTTGKQTGTPSKPGSASDLGFIDNRVSLSGGGNLSIAAGGDVIGGVYYTGSGAGEITAAGAIKGSQANAGPVLALGDSTFRLDAGGDIALGAAINPTVLRTQSNKDFFFTYSDGSGIELRSLSGKVTVQNDLNGLIDSVNRLRPLNDQLNFPGASFLALSVYPASLNVQALQGNIELGRSFITYPSAKGRFDLYAGGSIVTGKLGDNVNITQSDADPTLLPSVDFPTASYEDAAQRLQAFGDPNLIHAQTPVHKGDASSAHIHAQNGGILPQDPLLFELATPVQVNAATDIVDASFKLQHSDYALSSISAGRDIRFTSPRNAQGNLVNLTRQIELAGPGQLWVSAGRTIDLGSSEGIYTLGNTFNRALAEEGASISVLAGLSSPAQFDPFAKAYDPTSDQYQVKVGVNPDTKQPIYVRALTAYMRKRSGDDGLTDAAAAAAYRALPSDQQREFLLTVLFSEVRQAATQAAKSGKLKDYEPGYKAIDTLFPGAASLDDPDTKYQGDLKLFFSKIHTVSGGDINLLVPGGLVNAGLAVAFSGSKPASDLGIVAQRDGAVNALVDGNFQVNQSRVFAMDGGDITVWSSNGNIDAGRGAKAAIAAPPPLVTFDAQGNLQVEFPPVVSGSGIRTAASSSGVQPGDVYLAAPRGVVDAGEAGIGANNITIAATAVIGASNISVSGTSSGVPSTNVTVPVAPSSAANAAANAAQNAQQSAGTNAEQDQAKRDQLAESAHLTPLDVEVVGFGDCSVNDVHEGKPGCS
ncbi:MAG: filamentous hemagglutinin family protein, partial [Methylococcaceae bacterium]|nr:filamentous hemagglutinin family protein [Methylococcaceae bacterium]